MASTTHSTELARGDRFEFGANWHRFLSSVDEERIRLAQKSLRERFGVSSMLGRTFLDVGSGSGLSSLAARGLGAAVRSFDYDPVSVECTRHLRDRYFPNDSQWTVEQGSATDPAFLRSLGQHDYVYSFGVLHHTGAMWAALNLSAGCVKRGGYFELMLYSDDRCASMWHTLKRMYVGSPAPVKWAMRNTFATVKIARIVLQGRNPRRVIRDYRINAGRGMSWYIDLTDWIGGYPFEWAGAQQTIDFMRERGFELASISPPISPRGLGLLGTGSYQYLFRRNP